MIVSCVMQANTVTIRHVLTTTAQQAYSGETTCQSRPKDLYHAHHSARPRGSSHSLQSILLFRKFFRFPKVKARRRLPRLPDLLVNPIASPNTHFAARFPHSSTRFLLPFSCPTLVSDSRVSPAIKVEAVLKASGADASPLVASCDLFDNCSKSAGRRVLEIFTGRSGAPSDVGVERSNAS